MKVSFELPVRSSKGVQIKVSLLIIDFDPLKYCLEFDNHEYNIRIPEENEKFVPIPDSKKIKEVSVSNKIQIPKAYEYHTFIAHANVYDEQSKVIKGEKKLILAKEIDINTKKNSVRPRHKVQATWTVPQGFIPVKYKVDLIQGDITHEVVKKTKMNRSNNSGIYYTVTDSITIPGKFNEGKIFIKIIAYDSDDSQVEGKKCLRYSKPSFWENLVYKIFG